MNIIHSFNRPDGEALSCSNKEISPPINQSRLAAFTLGLFMLPILFTGCAEVVIEKDGNGQGYDVFRPEPYLLVFTQSTDTTITSPAPADKTKKKPEKPATAPKTAINTGEDAAAAPAAGGAGTPTAPPTTPTTPNQPSTPAPAAPTEGISGPGMAIVWLPNYSQRYRVHSSAFFLAKAGAQFSIQDGWMLTGVTDQSDNTALLTAAQTIFSSALGSASSTAKTAATTGGFAPLDNAGGTTTTKTTIKQDFRIYKFIFNERGDFYGLAEVPFQDADLKLPALRKLIDSPATLEPAKGHAADE